VLQIIHRQPVFKLDPRQPHPQTAPDKRIVDGVSWKPKCDVLQPILVVIDFSADVNDFSHASQTLRTTSTA